MKYTHNNEFYLILRVTNIHIYILSHLNKYIPVNDCIIESKKVINQILKKGLKAKYIASMLIS